MDKALKAYLDGANEIIGDRTSSEEAHDNAVVEALNEGYPIEKALAIAGEKHPDEAIEWDKGTIADIAAHYEYLREHARIMQMLKGKQ
ncbi:hypothetical protein [Syntrophorhabdus aromaticivorans]|jgi:hypothetical protein|uniref:Uncharacterized protein n=1 Tax=Syntrophorhabdus aromaticivorans TaxID=328301 RepID=A0A351U2U4_9BACT|nr:hypothetical protein [Syntrophorhabdus aromaticivorans]NLW36175.1 hypothetical protein [Syntrophorhabdus aromaticivorans]HBA54275.1 hypothetical protein [Syntrophorhabdus aromaticivorans]